MGILNKLLFWRHDELDFDKIADREIKVGKDLSTLDHEYFPDLDEKSPFPEPQAVSPAFAPRTASPYKQTNYQTQQNFRPAGNMEKDLELISSKLDTIKVMLSSLDQRTANLERAAGIEQQKRQRLW